LRPHLGGGADDQQVLDGLRKDAGPRPHQLHRTDGLLLLAIADRHIVPAKGGVVRALTRKATLQAEALQDIGLLQVAGSSRSGMYYRMRREVCVRMRSHVKFRQG